MKILLFPCLFLISLNAFSQTNKFKFGANFAPAICGNFIFNDGSVPEEVVASNKRIERKKVGFYGYLFINYSIGVRASIQAGAGYSNTGYMLSKTKLVFADPEPDAPNFIEFSIIHHDLIMPVLFRYNLTNQKNFIYLIGGSTPEINQGRIKKRVLKYEDGRKETTKEEDKSTDYRSFNVNGTFGIGYDLKINKMIRLFFQPTFDCNMLGTSKNAGLNRNIYSIALNMGLTIG